MKCDWIRTKRTTKKDFEDMYLGQPVEQIKFKKPRSLLSKKELRKLIRYWNWYHEKYLKNPWNIRKRSV